MFELILNPKSGERKPWSLFLVGMFYSALALFFVNWVFLGNPVFMEYTSILIITFTVILSIPFVYYLFKIEEEKDIFEKEKHFLVKSHGKAITALMWLFLGYLVAFAILYVVLPKNVVAHDFKAQIEQYCTINSNNVQDCVARYGIGGAAIGIQSLSMEEKQNRVINIFVNNIFVLIFCLVFSLAFGAGAIFILAWNASVIATAMGIFSKATLSELPLAFGRYMLHGIPEILAYFIGALAGGIISLAIVRHDWRDERFWIILQDSLDLIVLSIVILIIASLMEVFITPAIF